MESILNRLRGYVSPVFLALLVASFILWYLAKLSYTYTTEQTIRVSIDGFPIEVACVVEGLGTNLFGYRVYTSKVLRIPLAELKSERFPDEEGTYRVAVDPQSLQHAISVRISDIKVVSIGAVPELRFDAETSKPC